MNIEDLVQELVEWLATLPSEQDIEQYISLIGDDDSRFDLILAAKAEVARVLRTQCLQFTNSVPAFTGTQSMLEVYTYADMLVRAKEVVLSGDVYSTWNAAVSQDQKTYQTLVAIDTQLKRLAFLIACIRIEYLSPLLGSALQIFRSGFAEQFVTTYDALNGDGVLDDTVLSTLQVKGFILQDEVSNGLLVDYTSSLAGKYELLTTVMALADTSSDQVVREGILQLFTYEEQNSVLEIVATIDEQVTNQAKTEPVSPVLVWLIMRWSESRGVEVEAATETEAYCRALTIGQKEVFLEMFRSVVEQYTREAISDVVVVSNLFDQMISRPDLGSHQEIISETCDSLEDVLLVDVRQFCTNISTVLLALLT